MTKQIETAQIVGTIINPGNVKLTMTGARLSTNPTVVSVAVLGADDASAVAGKCRTALALNSVISNIYQVSGATDKIILTERVDAANDATLNVASDNDTCTGLTAEPTSTHTQAGDGLSNAYCTLAQIKAKGILNLAGSPSDTDYDVMLERIINDVSRRIDTRCGRFFYQVLQTRHYTPTDHWRIFVDDFASAAGLVLKTDWNGDGIYETTWLATDYVLEPQNALFEGLPYTMIHRQLYGSYYFPASRYGVELTALFGWPVIPPVVEDVCLLQSERFFRRLSTPLGAAKASGNASKGIPAFDPDIVDLLKPPYVKTV